ncbi:MAG: Ig-like domain-containing protein, partial [Halothiobacillaceae bacterium]|nr:Ig-like domain-containing protein [Halothiobacillaceae bacterium]
MKKFERFYKPLPWLPALALTALLAGCGGGGQAPILGAGGAVQAPVVPPVVPPAPPTVTAVAPLNNATGVPINNTLITAAFSEPMAAITGGASFTVT